jgi:hypothetical protein
VGLSGFIYVAIVLGWAVYLVPGAVRRYEEASRSRSVERFSSRMRLLGRDGPAAPADADAAPDVPPGDAPAAAAAPPAAAPPVPEPERRAAARTAARRRRRVLLVLLLAAAVTAVAAGLSVLSWWTVVVPGGLVVVWLAACRGQARHESDVSWARDGGYVEPAADDLRRTNRLQAPVADDGLADGERAVAPPVPGGPAATADPPVVDSPADPPVDVAPNDEPTVVFEREPGGEVGSEDTEGGSLWDPVPVTLPTYVHKPRAPRTIRTVDLDGSGDAHSPRRPRESAIYTHRVERASFEDSESESRSEGTDGTTEHRGPARRAVGE